MQWSRVESVLDCCLGMIVPYCLHEDSMTEWLFHTVCMRTVWRNDCSILFAWGQYAQTIFGLKKSANFELPTWDSFSLRLYVTWVSWIEYMFLITSAVNVVSRLKNCHFRVSFFHCWDQPWCDLYWLTWLKTPTNLLISSLRQLTEHSQLWILLICDCLSVKCRWHFSRHCWMIDRWLFDFQNSILCMLDHEISP